MLRNKVSLWTLVLVLSVLTYPSTVDKHQRVKKVRKLKIPRDLN